MNILIVDDEPLACQRLRTLLSDCQHQRTTVAKPATRAKPWRCWPHRRARL